MLKILFYWRITHKMINIILSYFIRSDIYGRLYQFRFYHKMLFRIRGWFYVQRSDFSTVVSSNGAFVLCYCKMPLFSCNLIENIKNDLHNKVILCLTDPHNVNLPSWYNAMFHGSWNCFYSMIIDDILYLSYFYSKHRLLELVGTASWR